MPAAQVKAPCESLLGGVITNNDEMIDTVVYFFDDLDRKYPTLTPKYRFLAIFPPKS
jgi:hypothetical protein